MGDTLQATVAERVAQLRTAAHNYTGGDEKLAKLTVEWLAADELSTLETRLREAEAVAEAFKSGDIMRDVQKSLTEAHERAQEAERRAEKWQREALSEQKICADTEKRAQSAERQLSEMRAENERLLKLNERDGKAMTVAYDAMNAEWRIRCDTLDLQVAGLREALTDLLEMLDREDDAAAWRMVADDVVERMARALDPDAWTTHQGHRQEVARDEVKAILSAAEQAGYVLVPREPTPAMINAASEFHADGCWNASDASVFGGIYRAMITASASLPHEDAGDDNERAG